jgi:hypothetical protein
MNFGKYKYESKGRGDPLSFLINHVIVLFKAKFYV